MQTNNETSSNKFEVWAGMMIIFFLCEIVKNATSVQ